VNTAAEELPVELVATKLGFIKGIPEIVDANADLVLQVEVSCIPVPVKPTGSILIIDAQGTTLASSPLLDEETEVEAAEETATVESAEKPALIHPKDVKPTPEELDRVLGPREEEPELTRIKTAAFTVKAPAIMGDYIWTARFLPDVNEENGSDEVENTGGEELRKINFQENTAEIAFTVRAHLITLSVWNIPIPVTKGERFNVSIGAACSSACSLAGLDLCVRTEAGTQNIVMGSEILPNTKATYWTEIELQAPDDEKIHNWAVDCELPKSDHPHQIESAPFAFCTAALPENLVTITIIDDRDMLPIKGAYVMVGQYQTVSDEQGIAAVKVPAGKHRLSVIQRDYIFDDQEIDVTDHMAFTVTMSLFPIV
jgi:hypothetical protein